MAYEIPQQLQHKEKIMFGLTFSQLGWAVLFACIGVIILKLGISGPAKFMLGLAVSITAIFFIFFDVGRWMSYIGGFLKFRSATLNSGNMKRLVEISKVEKDIIHSHKEVAVLQVTPLNFSIRTKDEKDTIIYGFQKFLNALDFPVQFVVTTHNLDIKDYLKKLEKRITNKALFDDFTNFLKTLIEKNEMHNRSFYLVIPKTADLDIQCNVCRERLDGIGLRVRRLNDKEILDNLYFFFNDVKDERNYDFKLPENFLEKNELIRKLISKTKKIIRKIDDYICKIRKKEPRTEDKKEDKEFKDSFHFLIAPNYVKDNVDSVLVNSKNCRIVSAIGYPRMVESGFLDRIISSNDDFDISIHIEPFPIETMMITLNKEIQKQRADLFAEKTKNSINPSLEIKYKDTLKVLEELQKGKQKLFNVSLYINCKAKTKEQLDFLSKKVEAELNSLMIQPNIPYFRQVPGYKSMVPIAKDELKIKRNITTDALSAFFPFTSPFLQVENSGVMLGLNKNRVPLIRDIFGLSNANGVILATSGSGKSYFTKLLIERQHMNGVQALIIDPQAEYIGLTKHCNGELITISRESKAVINPLDLMGHDYVEKRLALMDIFQIMFGDLSEIQKSILDKALTETYLAKGINADSYVNKKPPILGDLYKTLDKMDKKASPMEKSTYRALLNRLYMYTEGVFSFMNRQSNIKFNKSFVTFNIGNMPKQVKPLVMFLILDFVYMRMKESKEKKLLVIDEAWSLLQRAEEASYIFEIVKTCRKYNMGLLLITQDVADLIGSKAGHAVLANSSYTFLLRQKPSIIKEIMKTFNLSEMEKEYLLTATQGRGVLIMDNEHQELEVVASPEEHKIITTNPNEEITEQTEEEETTEVNAKVSTDKPVYKGKNLSLEKKNYLRNHGYEAGNFMAIGEPRQEEYWVKSNKVESIAHTFLVHNIAEILSKHTKNIEINITQDADIIFTNRKKQKIAIEVETGENFMWHRKRIVKKFHDARMKYKNRLFLVLTQNKYLSHYKNLELNIPIMLRKDIEQFIKEQFKR